MISPESGIHRPSYNGAPAMQTLNINELESPIALPDQSRPFQKFAFQRAPLRIARRSKRVNQAR